MRNENKQVPDIQARIAYLISKLTGNNTRFSEATGLSTTMLSNIVGNRRSNPSYESLETIKRVFPQVSGDWLLSGLGEPFLSGQEPLAYVPPKDSRQRPVAEPRDVSLSIIRESGTVAITDPSIINSSLAILLRDSEEQRKSLEYLIAAKDETIAAKDELIAALRGK